MPIILHYSITCKAIIGLTGLIFLSGNGMAEPVFGQNANNAGIRLTELDRLMTEFMQLTGATAGTLAINRSGESIFSDAWGHSDRRQKVPTRIQTTMRLASCTKPVTRAAIESLIAAGKFQRDESIFDYLNIRPAGGQPGDARIPDITIQHLLDHTGGWDREATFDPLYRTDEIGRELGIGRVQKRHIAKYMWSRPLQSEPGAEEHYSNFGYLLLGLAIEKATGKSYLESIRELIGEPLGIDDFSISSPSRSARTPREVTYPRENRLNLKLRDSASGLVCSAPSLCKFMDAWWIDGRPRNDYRNVYLFQIGSHPQTTTTIMEQRLDGLDYALMLNARREETYNDDNLRIRELFNDWLDRNGDRLGE